MNRYLPSIYPRITGTEEEIRVSFFNDEELKRGRPLEEQQVDEVLRGIDIYCPPIQDASEFRSNGSRIYNDNGIELATPECDTPRLQAIYIRANAELAIRALSDYMSDYSYHTGVPTKAILWRRSTDAHGTTWACHDNYSLHTDTYDKEIDLRLQRFWKVYLQSRGIVSGAGLVLPSGIQFAQKMSVSHYFTGHGTNAYMLDVRGGSNKHFEIRCSDTNIKDWATISRIGGGALALAATQTRLLETLMDSRYYDVVRPEHLTNQLYLDRNLEPRKTKRLSRVIDIQRFTYETALNQLDKVHDRPVPGHYRAVGKQILHYLDDLDAVLAGHAELETLADRSDWAQKVVMIRAGVRRDEKPSENGSLDSPESRRMQDAKAQATDMLYGQTTLLADVSGNVNRSDGYGLRIADKQSVLDKTAIERAKTQPPRNTRATVRVRRAAELGDKLVGCDWDELTYEKGNEQLSIRLKKQRR